MIIYDRGIDYAGLRPALRGNKSPAHFGARFVLRYSSGAANRPNHRAHHLGKWKLITPGEFRDLVDAGYDVIANSEWYESRVTEGAGAGREDGEADLDLWRSCGLHRGASIYVSWDEGQPARGKHDALAEYLRAYQRALDGHYHVDLYAGDVALHAMLDRRLIRYGWRAMADSWSQDGDWYQPGDGWRRAAERIAKVSPAHIVQNGNRWYNGDADEDVTIRTPVGSHLEAGHGGGHGDGEPRPTHHKPAHHDTRVYEVRRGDTMSGIAAAHHMSLHQLEQLNPHAGHPSGNYNNIWPGDKLRVKGKPTTSHGKPVHVVQPGDTLSGIASGWGVSLRALEHANPHAGHPSGNYNNIWPGDRITHP